MTLLWKTIIIIILLISGFNISANFAMFDTVANFYNYQQEYQDKEKQLYLQMLEIEKLKIQKMERIEKKIDKIKAVPVI